MVTRRRVLSAVAVLLIAAVAWTVWLTVRTATDLRRAEASVNDLSAALEAGDASARDEARTELLDASASAHDRTDGFWWAAMTKVPVLGDDAAGVRALSQSLDILATGAVAPLADTVDALDTVVVDGRVDVAALTALQQPVTQAHDVLLTAGQVVEAQDSAGFAGPLKKRFDEYTSRVSDLEAGMGSAETAIQVLPDMLGADRQRDYLFIFQNNAEIRATGGLAGSWAHIVVDNGKIALEEQGSAGDFPFTPTPYVPLTDEEVKVYSPAIGQFFSDPNLTPDFPRAAEIYQGFWDHKFPKTQLDGVISLDPVGMSYLIGGIGPISVGDLTLTADNFVPELLSNTYNIPDPVKQDVVFQQAAKRIFEVATTGVASPIEFVKGLVRAVDESRFLVAPFDDRDAGRLAGTAVLGDLTGDDGATPHVDIGLNDATASKMSYYLRYYAEVEAQSCSNNTQHLVGRMTLRQSIPKSEAAKLSDSVTGDFQAYGLDRGSQIVAVRIYGPYGGTITNLQLEGKKVDFEVSQLGGRPVVKLLPVVESADDVVITWEMDSGPGQSADGELWTTPSVVTGNTRTTIGSPCTG